MQLLSPAALQTAPYLEYWYSHVEPISRDVLVTVLKLVSGSITIQCPCFVSATNDFIANPFMSKGRSINPTHRISLFGISETRVDREGRAITAVLRLSPTRRNRTVSREDEANGGARVALRGGLGGERGSQRTDTATRRYNHPSSRRRHTVVDPSFATH